MGIKLLNVWFKGVCVRSLINGSEGTCLLKLVNYFEN